MKVTDRDDILLYVTAKHWLESVSSTNTIICGTAEMLEKHRLGNHLENLDLVAEFVAKFCGEAGALLTE